jgi:hypothetical protein
MNLNEISIPTDGEPIPLSDNSCKVASPAFENIEVIFRELESNLVNKIREFENGLIFGSVAWLTSFKILDELAKCNNVQIVVQKEDFLRPDLNSENKDKWKELLRMKYSNLNFEHDRYDLRYPINELSVCGDPSVGPIRCVGNHNSKKQAAFPRAHNKFLVFCEFVEKSTDETRKNKTEIYKPVAVWTGSFNLTWNSANSFENAIFLEDKKGDNPIINGFLKEHHQIYALSEKLNWETDWIAPEFRIGT